MAFNSKNLHYEKNEPAFLRKLRGEYGNDRQTFQAARPKRDRLRNDDDDDAPAMMTEDGASVSKDEYEAMMNGTLGRGNNGKIAPTEDAKASEAEEEDKAGGEKQKVVDAGMAKKRKHVKVVKADGEKETVKPMKDKIVKKPKKKIKLSFDQPED